MKDFIGSGSSRNVFYVGIKKILLDGKEVEVPVCVKESKKSNYDTADFCFGEAQNKNESNNELDKFRILTKTGVNSYTTNNDGILTPVFDFVNGSLSTLSITPYISGNTTTQLENDDVFDCLLKTIDVHNISLVDLHDIFIDVEINKKTPHKIKNKYLINKHPLIKNVSNLILKGLVCGYDITDSNWGYYKHPLTGKEKILLLDYGMTSSLMEKMSNNKYRIARS